MIRKCFIFIPPKNNIDSINNATHIVTDIFGSNKISRQIIPPKISTGITPKKLRIALVFSLIYPAVKTTKQYFAISDG